MKQPSWTAGVSKRVLANGLTSLVHPDPAAPAVAVVIHVKAGFFDEPDRWQGISHVLEHMFFKGTPTRGVGQIAAETKGLGGYLNASTSYDWTSYYVVLPADGFRAALAIQADALRNASIDAGELGRELKVIIEEAKRKLDSPAAVAHETLHEVLFDQHRIRRWRIGYAEQLAGFTQDDVAGYYRSRYVPSRVIVSVVGAVEAEAAHAAIESLFGDWVSVPAGIDPSPAEPWRQGPARIRILHGDVKQVDVALGWRAVPEVDPDAAPLDLAAMVLSSGRGSWFYRGLREPGLATTAGAYCYSPTEVGVFSLGLDLEPANLDRGVETAATLVARLRDQGPTPADIDRVKTLLVSQWARRFESVEGRASALASAEALGGVERIEAEFRDLMAVEPARVREVAARYLGPAAIGGVFYLPDGVDTGWSAERLAETFGARGVAPASVPVPPVPPPAIAPIPSRRRARAGIHHVELPGADLLIRPKAGVPMVAVGVYRRRRVIESARRAGVGALTIRSSVRGAGGYDAAALTDLFETLGGSLGASVAADWFGFGAHILADRWLDAAILLDLVNRRPGLEAGEVARERTTLRSEVVQTADDMFRRPIELVLAAAFGPAGYGLPIKGTVASVDQLDQAAAQRWHAEEMAAGRTTVIAVGDLDPARAADGLAAIFSPGSAAEAATSGPASAWRPAEALRTEHRQKSQTALAMLFPGPARNDPDRFAAEVLSAVASGLGGRLFHSLRDQRSLAYTVMMSSWQRARAGAIMTYIATSPDREDEARSAMLTELARFGTDLVSDEEFDRAVNYLAGQALVQRQTSGAILGEIADAWLIGDGLDDVADPAAGYRAVTRESIREVAARYLISDQRAEGVVRGTAGGR